MPYQSPHESWSANYSFTSSSCFTYCKTHFGSVFLLNPCKGKRRNMILGVSRLGASICPCARSSVCELSSELLFLHWNQVYQAPQFAFRENSVIPCQLVPSIFSQFPRPHTEISAFDLLPQVTDRCDVMCQFLQVLISTSTSTMNPSVGFWYTVSSTNHGSLIPAVFCSSIFLLCCLRGDYPFHPNSFQNTSLTCSGTVLPTIFQTNFDH